MILEESRTTGIDDSCTVQISIFATSLTNPQSIVDAVILLQDPAGHEIDLQERSEVFKTKTEMWGEGK